MLGKRKDPATDPSVHVTREDKGDFTLETMTFDGRRNASKMYESNDPRQIAIACLSLLNKQGCREIIAYSVNRLTGEATEMTVTISTRVLSAEEAREHGVVK